MNKRLERDIVLRGKNDSLNSLALLLIVTVMVACVVACVSLSDDSNGQDANGIEGGIEWSWDADAKKLTIKATDSPKGQYNKGEMPDYDGEDPPWKSLIVDGSTLVIENDVTRIGSYAFYKCSGFKGELKIGSGVITIEEEAFLECTGFTGDLIIPDSVSTIELSAFDGCSGFNGELKIGSGVKKIEMSAFSKCSGFTGDIVIPKGVTKIKDGAFAGCGGKGFVVENGNTKFTEKEGMLLNKDEGAIIACLTGKTGTLMIPNGITTINEKAFFGCTGFTGDLVIPDGVMAIGNLAFCECSGFTGDLIISDSVVYIEGYAFMECSGLDGYIIIGSGIDESSKLSFIGCGGKGFVLNGNTNFTVKEGMLLNKNGDTILACPTGKTGTLTIPDGITTINDNSFYLCSGFTGDLIIPDGVTTIRHFAFLGCSGFTGDLIIPDGVTYLGEGAFNGCIGINGNIIIGKGIDEIYKTTFRDILPTSITIPSTVKTIEMGAFNMISFYDGTTEITDYSKLPGYTYASSDKSNGKFIQEDIWNVFFASNGGSKSVNGLHKNEGNKFSLPSYDGTKTGYKFVGWSYGGETYPAGTEFTKVKDDMTFVAAWEIIQCTATFMNGDKLISQNTYDYGSVIVAPTEIPTKESTAQYDYVFSRWDGFTQGMKITGDITFNAVFDEVTRTYTATFMNGDTVFSQKTYDYGSVIVAPTETPTKGSTAQYDYKFSHWEGFTEGMKITGNTTFNAVFDEVPKSSDSNNTMIIIIGVIVVLAIIGAGAFYYFKVRKH